MHVEAFGLEQAPIEERGKGAVKGLDQNGPAADPERPFQLREKALGVRKMMKTILAIKGSHRIIVQAHCLGIERHVEFLAGDNVRGQDFRVRIAHGRDARPQLHLQTPDLEIAVCQSTERVVEFHEDFPEHLLAFKHLAVKFEAFAAIDIQRLERRVR
ncbi:hypothetical protein [Pseudomonas sp. Z1-29]|uniref:hypothetical protein n=1 Tax=Pseudomonas sp. Z1-29 TaxID=2817410 RepID=UPI003DA9C20E